MRLTVEQRLRALERENVVLQDTIKVLHKLVKDQGHLINEYIVRRVAAAGEEQGQNGPNARPEEELYTFVCQRRFDKIERDIKKALKLIESSRFGLKAG
ncbi:MAG: hypothetical protein ACYS6I_05330 [Planctomycetota bacterium]|jgi:hypothetical protein